jgi:hypothetical protein
VGPTGPAGTSYVGGGFGGPLPLLGFTMSLYSQTVPTPMIVAGTLSHFTVSFGSAVNTNTVLVLEKNGSPTGITCTVPAGGKSCSDTTHTATFAPSETVLVQASYAFLLNSGQSPSWSGVYQ